MCVKVMYFFSVIQICAAMRAGLASREGAKDAKDLANNLNNPRSRG